jgi:hypothetical protein
MFEVFQHYIMYSICINFNNFFCWIIYIYYQLFDFTLQILDLILIFFYKCFNILCNESPKWNITLFKLYIRNKNEINELMNHYKILFKIEKIILIISIWTLMNYFDYKWTWQLYNDSSFIQNKMETRVWWFGSLVRPLNELN